MTQSRNSCTVFAGKSGRTMSTFAVRELMAMYSKFAGSNDILNRNLFEERTGEGTANNVYPSGCDRNTASAPIFPPAPARLSTMIVLPHRL